MQRARVTLNAVKYVVSCIVQTNSELTLGILLNSHYVT